MSIEFVEKIYLWLCFLFYIFIQSRHIIIMTDTFSKIKNELLRCYPDITDDDVNKPITFFKLSAKALREVKKIEKETQTTSSP